MSENADPLGVHGGAGAGAGAGGQEWISKAREGSKEALDRLLFICRDYLLLVANREVGEGLRAKVSPSDLVQETLLLGFEKFKDFRGETSEEFFGWLRAILVNQCRDAQRRHWDAQKRNVANEIPLDGKNADSRGPWNLADSAPSPSQRAQGNERAAILEEALATLPVDYQQVLRLRAWEGRQFDDVGAIMGRSSESARKLWARAIESLGEILRTTHAELDSAGQSR